MVQLKQMVCAAIGVLGLASPGEAQAPPPARTVLFRNVRVFDGRSAALTAPSYVLVRGNKIEKVSAQPIPTDRSGDTLVNEGGGRTLMPYALARKLKVKTAWGTDVLFSPENAAGQGKMLSKMARWYTPAEALKMATADNAELLALSGPRNPYPGKLGVVEEGALADLLLVDGDPLANIDLIGDPAKNFVVIMKDGKVYKNTLRSRE